MGRDWHIVRPGASSARCPRACRKCQRGIWRTWRQSRAAASVSILQGPHEQRHIATHDEEELDAAPDKTCHFGVALRQGADGLLKGHEEVQGWLESPHVAWDLQGEPCPLPGDGLKARGKCVARDEAGVVLVPELGLGLGQGGLPGIAGACSQKPMSAMRSAGIVLQKGGGYLWLTTLWPDMSRVGLSWWTTLRWMAHGYRGRSSWRINCLAGSMGILTRRPSRLVKPLYLSQHRCVGKDGQPGNHGARCNVISWGVPFWRAVRLGEMGNGEPMGNGTRL